MTSGTRRDALVRARAELAASQGDLGWIGRRLLASLQRMGRSELAVPIISTQLVTDALIGERESLENLVGATFVFGMRSDAEAARALALLGLDGEDRRARQLLLGLDAGRCLMRVAMTSPTWRIEALSRSAYAR